MLGLWILGSVVEPSDAQEWTRVRGPDGTGMIEECKTVLTK